MKNCALKLVNEVILYYDARSKKTSNYLDIVSPLAISQCQVDSIYSDLSCAFNLIAHRISLHKRCAHGLSDGYRFQRYFTDRQSSVGIFYTLSLIMKIFRASH